MGPEVRIRLKRALKREAAKFVLNRTGDGISRARQRLAGSSSRILINTDVIYVRSRALASVGGEDERKGQTV